MVGLARDSAWPIERSAVHGQYTEQLKRNEIESINRPIVCGGVSVMPGDVIVGDGDGVVVVPRANAEAVALHARKILGGDKAGRRRLYDRLGLPSDDSVK